MRILEELTSAVRFYLVYETCRGFLHERKIRVSWMNPRGENDKQTLLAASKGGVMQLKISRNLLLLRFHKKGRIFLQ